MWHLATYTTFKGYQFNTCCIIHAKHLSKPWSWLSIDRLVNLHSFATKKYQCVVVYLLPELFSPIQKEYNSIKHECFKLHKERENEGHLLVHLIIICKVFFTRAMFLHRYRLQWNIHVLIRKQHVWRQNNTIYFKLSIYLFYTTSIHLFYSSSSASIVYERERVIDIWWTEECNLSYVYSTLMLKI